MAELCYLPIIFYNSKGKINNNIFIKNLFLVSKIFYIFLLPIWKKKLFCKNEGDFLNDIQIFNNFFYFDKCFIF